MFSLCKKSAYKTTKEKRTTGQEVIANLYTQGSENYWTYEQHCIPRGSFFKQGHGSMQYRTGFHLQNVFKVFKVREKCQQGWEGGS